MMTVTYTMSLTYKVISPKRMIIATVSGVVKGV